MRDVKSVIRDFLSDNFLMGRSGDIGDDTSFMDTHLLDSTGFLELVTFVESKFGVKVADEELLPENFDSLCNIESYLARKRALNPA
jgi:acyl carrier protein